MLLRELEADHLADDWAERRCVSSTEAVLALVSTRLRNVRRAVSGAMDPEKLSAEHNRKSVEGDDDIYLESWDAERTRAELRRVQRRLRREHSK